MDNPEFGTLGAKLSGWWKEAWWGFEGCWVCRDRVRAAGIDGDLWMLDPEAELCVIGEAECTEINAASDGR